MGKWTETGWSVLTAAASKKLFSMFQYGRLNALHLLERMCHWQKERYSANVSLTGTTGDGSYGAVRQVPIAYMDTACEVTNVEIVQEAKDGVVVSTGDPIWCRVGYTEDDFATVHGITTSEDVHSDVVTSQTIAEGTVPDGALIFLEVDVANSETFVGRCNVSVVRTEL